MFYNKERRDKMVNIRLTEKEKNELSRLAKSEGLNVTSFICKCIDNYIKHGFQDSKN